MKRRQLLVGLTGLTAGVTTAVGSGAFSSVDAERTVSLDVETDQHAYLVLDGISENFVYDDDLVGFEFDEEVAPDDGTFEDTGDGVGANSSYEFPNLVQVQNRGTDDIVVFGRYDDSAVESIKLIEEGRPAPLTKANPSSVIPAPGGYIRVGLLIEVGDIPPEQLDTAVTIVAVSAHSERHPDVFPDGS